MSTATPAQKSKALADQVRTIQQNQQREQDAIDRGNRVYAQRASDVEAARAVATADNRAQSVFERRAREAAEHASVNRYVG